MGDVREEHQLGVGGLLELLGNLIQLVLLLVQYGDLVLNLLILRLQFLVHGHLALVGFPQGGEQDEEDDYEQHENVGDGPLLVEADQAVVEDVRKPVKAPLPLGYLLRLELVGGVVRFVDHPAVELVLLLVWQPVEDVPRHIHDLVASGGVYEAGVDLPLADVVEAASRHGETVDSDYEGLLHEIVGADRVVHAGRHLVVHGENGVYVRDSEAVDDPAHLGVRHVPEIVGRSFGHHLYSGVLADSVHEAFISFSVRGGPAETPDDDHVAGIADVLGHISRKLPGQAVVVGPDEGRIVVGLDFPVEQNDRNP